MAADQYTLRCELRGHEEDVRGACVISESLIATGSRDKSVRVWSAAEDGAFSLSQTLVGHTDFVGPIAWIPPGAQYTTGALVSGSRDKRVLVWDLATAAHIAELAGHTFQVTSLSVTSSGDVVSGSLDKTARVWHGASCVATLEGHEGPVLAVLALPGPEAEGGILTGSGDTHIRLWRGGKVVHTYSGHTDTVRGLALFPGVGFVSASHDGTARVWAVSGETLLHLVGHTALVYAAAVHPPSGLVATASEDCTVRVWRSGACVQTLQHPGCVWDCAFLPSGDLITACSDGVVRIWTTSPERAAPAEVRETLESQVAAREAAKTVGGVAVGDLPGIEALQESGKKEGQTKIVREGGVAVAYSWSAKEYQWEKVGEVVDGPNTLSAGRPTFAGTEYDFVFDVDIGDGVPPRKLPVNRDDNPYTVADRWLLDNELPMAYREQIVDFIIQNTGGAQPTPMEGVIADPFTGGNAYVPPPASASRQPATARPPPINADPFTGTAATRGGGETSTSGAAAGLVHVPKRGYLVFDTAPWDNLSKKLREFSALLAAQPDTAHLALTRQDDARLQAIVETLQATSRYHASTFAAADYSLVGKLCSWPPPQLFPALDLLRMLLLHPNAARHYAQPDQPALADALRAATSGAPPPQANLVTATRVAVNTFRHNPLQDWAQAHQAEVLDLLADCSAPGASKGVKLGYATLLLNYAVRLSAGGGTGPDEDAALQTLSGAVELASNAQQEGDQEALYRALLAIGTMVLNGKAKHVAQDLGVTKLADTFGRSLDKKLQEVAGDITKLLN